VVVTEQQREPAGDYGYDMAHEDTTREPTGAGESRHEREPVAGRRGPADQDGDYGYDEAHSY
jgi:hypothetical protein